VIRTRPPWRLIVADESFIVRDALQAVLRETPDMEVQAACGDYPALVAAIDAVPPDVLVTDIRMAPSWTDEGIRAASLLREVRPDAGIVIFSADAETRHLLELFSDGSGGRAYLLKDQVRQGDVIVSTVRAVARGGSVVDPKVVEILVAARTAPGESRLAELSPREREILGEIATGKTNGAIARTLHLSKRSVEKHVHAIFTKLHLGESEHLSPRVAAALIFLAEEPDRSERLRRSR
jgi:DNA-binding NarL/FixJ family response regulator